MAESTRCMGVDTAILPMCHWLYFEKNAWYWRNLFGRSWSNIRRLNRFIRDQGIDLVYTNTSAIFESAIAARRARVPHLWHIHEVLTPGVEMSQLLPIPWMQWIIKRYSDKVVFESHSAKSAFEKTTKLTDAEVVFNSVRIDGGLVPEEELVATRKLFGLSKADLTVVFVGQFIERKNPLLLIEAISNLSTERRIQCLFIGKGPLEEKMRDQIRGRGLERCCQLIPFQPNIRPFLGIADVLVLPSLQESFGLVLIEAGALGKPVIACRSEGPCEIVVDGQTGILINQQDAMAMTRAIDQFAISPVRVKEMGEQARLRMAELFSPQKNTRILESIMGRLLEKRHSLAGARSSSPG